MMPMQNISLSASYLFYMECIHSRVNSAVSKLLLNAQKLIVLCNTLGTAWCTGLDLAGIQCYCKICDRGVSRLTGAVRRNCRITCIVSHLDRFKCLRYGTDLIQLDQDRITAAKLNTLCQSLCIRYEQIIADKLYLISKLCSKLLPAFPVFLIESILDRDDRILLNKLLPVLDQLI